MAVYPLLGSHRALHKLGLPLHLHPLQSSKERPTAVILEPPISNINNTQMPGLSSTYCLQDIEDLPATHYI